MTNLPTRLMLAAGLSFASTGAMAQALQWQVSEAAGPVTIRHGGADRPATRGAVLEPGDAISTGNGGRAVLVHERDFVTLAPRSRTTVPVADQASGFTKLLQDLGNAVYKIEKRGVPHFGVSTPYLAAVVKGTTFSVTVDTSGTSLQVVEGAVEVATPDGGARDLIRPGSVATIAASDLFRLRVHGDEDRVVDSAARPGGSTPPNPAPASGPVAAPTASSAPAAANADTVVAKAGPEVVIATAITSKPVDLGRMSGGLMTGPANVGALTAAVTQAVKSATVAAVPSPGTPLPVLASVNFATPTAAIAPVIPSTVAVTIPAVVAVVATAAPIVTTPTVATPVVAAAPSALPVIAVAAPVVTGPVAPSAAITTPVVAPVVVAAVITTPVVAAPVVSANVAVPAVVAAVATAPAVAAPAVSTPVAVPAVVATVMTAPVVATPAVITPAVAIPAVTTPAVSMPAVITPVVVKPVLTIPVVTIPVINIPIITPIIRAIESLDDDLSSGGKGNNGNHNGWGKNGKGG